MWMGQPIYEESHPMYEHCTPVPELGESTPSQPSESEPPISLQELSQYMSANASDPNMRKLSYIASQNPDGYIDADRVLDMSTYVRDGYYVTPVKVPVAVRSSLPSTYVQTRPWNGAQLIGDLPNGTLLDMMSLRTMPGRAFPWAGVCGSNFCGWIGYESLAFQMR